MSVVETLKAAREVIATPEKWTKGASARDAAGIAVAADSDKAVCYCAYGALWRPGVSVHTGMSCLDLLSAAVPDSFIEKGNKRHAPSFNDHPETTHADVLALFDRAIELATKEGAK